VKKSDLEVGGEAQPWELALLHCGLSERQWRLVIGEAFEKASQDRN
jgi:hypothetical protein